MRKDLLGKESKARISAMRLPKRRDFIGKNKIASSSSLKCFPSIANYSQLT
jgi:hypothetical protein